MAPQTELDRLIGKRLRIEVCRRSTRQNLGGRGLLQTFGGFGFAREYGIERKWRETRLYQTAPISTNMVLAYIAQHVLGLPRSY
jgi:hypothetical protein